MFLYLGVGGEKLTVFSKKKHTIGDIEVTMNGYTIVASLPGNEILVKYDGVLGFFFLLSLLSFSSWRSSYVSWEAAVH